MRNLFDHASKRRSVGPLHNAVHFLKTQRPDDHLVLFRRTDNAADQFDFDGSWHGVYTLSCASPRRAAISPLSRNCSNASMVAFTTLCGLCEPMDFVRTFGIPTAV